MEKIDKNDSTVGREGLGSDIVVGTGCRRIRDFDACLRIGMLGANCVRVRRAEAGRALHKRANTVEYLILHKLITHQPKYGLIMPGH